MSKKIDIGEENWVLKDGKGGSVTAEEIRLREFRKKLVRGELVSIIHRVKQKPDNRLVDKKDPSQPWYFTHT